MTARATESPPSSERDRTEKSVETQPRLGSADGDEQLLGRIEAEPLSGGLPPVFRAEPVDIHSTGHCSDLVVLPGMIGRYQLLAVLAQGQDSCRASDGRFLERQGDRLVQVCDQPIVAPAQPRAGEAKFAGM